MEVHHGEAPGGELSHQVLRRWLSGRRGAECSHRHVEHAVLAGRADIVVGNDPLRYQRTLDHVHRKFDVDLRTDLAPGDRTLQRQHRRATRLNTSTTKPLSVFGLSSALATIQANNSRACGTAAMSRYRRCTTSRSPRNDPVSGSGVAVAVASTTANTSGSAEPKCRYSRCRHRRVGVLLIASAIEVLLLFAVIYHARALRPHTRRLRSSGSRTAAPPVRAAASVETTCWAWRRC